MLISALKNEQRWLNSLSLEDADAYFKLAGLTGDTALELYEMQKHIHKEITMLTVKGAAKSIYTTGEETGAAVFSEIAGSSAANSLAGKAVAGSGRLISLWPNYKAITTTKSLLDLFGDQSVNYSADYTCDSLCTLSVTINE